MITYILIKNWLIAAVGILILVTVIINPSFITKYGIRTAIIDNVVRGFAITVLLIWLIPQKSLFLDTIGYLSKKEQYIKKNTCVLSEIHFQKKATWFFFARKSLICENGNSYVDRLISQFYSKDSKLIIRYLPETTLIVDIEKIK